MAKKQVNQEEGNSYCRKFVLELYHDWENYDNITEFIKSHYPLYLGITHDKDIWTVEDYLEKQKYMDDNGIKIGDTKKIHDYYVIEFANPRYRYTIAKELGIDDRFVHKVKKYRGALEYSIHLNNLDKHQYSVDETFGTLKLELIKYVQSHIFEEQKSTEIMDIILLRPSITLKELLEEVNKRGLYSTFRQGYSIYKDLMQEHNMGVY